MLFVLLFTPGPGVCALAADAANPTAAITAMKLPVLVMAGPFGCGAKID
jgi:hypothetical protein